MLTLYANNEFNQKVAGKVGGYLHQAPAQVLPKGLAGFLPPMRIAFVAQPLYYVSYILLVESTLYLIIIIEP